VYDTGANQWDRVADLPSGRNHIGTAALDGAVYVVGGFIGNGFTPARDVYRYDPGADEWSTVASLPEARGALAVVALDGRLYASGGSGPIESVRQHAVYDPGTNVWTPLAQMPAPGRNHLAAVALDGYVYVVGGRSDGGGNVNSAQLDRYDPDTNTWQPLASMPTARSGHAAAVLAGRIVVMGGEVNPANPPDQVFTEVEAYDPATNTWVSLDPMADPRHGIGAVTVGDLIYVPGGATRAGFGATDAADALRVFW
jgi:N-acetylneuraminic acid mutarotase